MGPRPPSNTYVPVLVFRIRIHNFLTFSHPIFFDAINFTVYSLKFRFGSVMLLFLFIIFFYKIQKKIPLFMHSFTIYIHNIR
jgi:hypothetical protein